jgi:hypothetical protein
MDARNSASLPCSEGETAMSWSASAFAIAAARAGSVSWAVSVRRVLPLGESTLIR